MITKLNSAFQKKQQESNISAHLNAIAKPSTTLNDGPQSVGINKTWLYNYYDETALMAKIEQNWHGAYCKQHNLISDVSRNNVFLSIHSTLPPFQATSGSTQNSNKFIKGL